MSALLSSNDNGKLYMSAS